MSLIFDELEKVIGRQPPSFSVADKNSVNNGNYWLPSIDIKEEESSFTVLADLPGIEKKDIKVSMDKYNNLIIEGEKAIEVKDEKMGHICMERCKGSFFRKIVLPNTVDPQAISANYRNGVLEIVVAKSNDNTIKQVIIQD
jgi:HSP20 family protein